MADRQVGTTPENFGLSGSQECIDPYNSGCVIEMAYKNPKAAEAAIRKGIAFKGATAGKTHDGRNCVTCPVLDCSNRLRLS